MAVLCYEQQRHMRTKKYGGLEAQALLDKMTEIHSQVGNTPVLN
jgi:hypothetical protein